MMSCADRQHTQFSKVIGMMQTYSRHMSSCKGQLLKIEQLLGIRPMTWQSKLWIEAKHILCECICAILLQVIKNWGADEDQ